MVTLRKPTRLSPLKAGREANRFLLIASDWRAQLQPGGVSSYLHSLSQGLVSLGDTVRILAVVNPDESAHLDLLKKFEPWVVPFESVDDGKPLNWLGRKTASFLEILRCLSPNCRRALEKASFFKASTAAITRLERVLSEERPTGIIFVNCNTRLYWLALALLEWQRPYGIIAHGADVRKVVHSRHVFTKRRMMIRGANWIAANSNYTRSLLEAWQIPSDKIRVVYPPIPEEAIRESATYEPRSRQNDALSLATVSRLSREKGIDIALQALKLLAARGVPFRYVIGGDGRERGSLETLTDELGLRDSVEFRGWVDGAEKWQIFRNSDVFLMPSRGDSRAQQEGFGIASVEAGAFGVPAVGSRTGGVPEAVVDGETGIIVAEESPMDLADALTLLYRKPEVRKQMGRAARERARRLFSPKTIASRIREEALELRRC